MKLRRYIGIVLLASNVSAVSQNPSLQPQLRPQGKTTPHRFLDKKNLTLQAVNTASQTVALWAIHFHDQGGETAPCGNSPCIGALEARGRTLDPLEKHFESYGYGWGAAYRYGGGVGLSFAVAYLLHATGHHKLERRVPVVAIMHAQASTGYAFAGSCQAGTGC
jgi:hypothetical protein